MGKSYEFASDLTAADRRKFVARLLRLRDLLLTVKPERYDHDSYKYGKGCGTTCCALGWAATKKRLFPGLAVSFVNHGTGFWTINFPDHYEGEDEAADEYFGPDTYRDVFNSLAFHGENATPQTVARRIEQIVRERYGMEA